MNRLLYKKTTFLNLKPSHFFYKKILCSFSQQRESFTSLKKGQNTQQSLRIGSDINYYTEKSKLERKKPINQIFTWKCPKNLLIQQKYHTFYTNSFKKQKQGKSEVLSEVPTSQSTNFHAWLKRFILLTFIVSVLEQEGIKCDYDINDMMITIELDERLLTQEQENEGQEGSAAKEKKGKHYRSRRSTTGHSKDQRYGTVEEMIKHQMESSEDFHSVQERFLIKDIEEKRDQKKDTQNKKITEESQQQTHKDQAKQNIAHHIFKQEQKLKKPTQAETPELDHANQPTVLIEKEILDEDKKNPLNQSQKQTETDQILSKQDEKLEFIADAEKNKLLHKKEDKQHNQKVNQSQAQQSLFIDIQKAQMEKQLLIRQQKAQESKETQSQSEPIIIDTQNTATISIQSQSFKSLSKRIENFLKLRGITVFIKEKIIRSTQSNESQIKNLNVRLCNKLKECKDIEFTPENEQTRDVFHHMNNFLNPPHVIKTVQQAKSFLSLLQTDQTLIGSFIPTSSPQFQAYKQRSSLNTWSTRNPPTDPFVAQKTFNEYKYLSSSKKNCFVVVRDPEVAKYLKISTDKIGIPHIMFKYDSHLNGRNSEPNCKIDSEFYHVIGNVEKIIQKEVLDSVQKVAHKINTLTQRGFMQTNVIEDVHDKIRQMKEQGDCFSFTEKVKENNGKNKSKKMFVIKTNDPQSETQINEILQKLSKINKNEVSIVKTQSQALLKSLKIFNNDQYAILRLFDLQNNQEPIVKYQGIHSLFQQKGYFQRYIPSGPFQLEFLSRWISNLSPYDKPHIEVDRSINKLKSSYPHDFTLEHENGQRQLVLFYKQGCKGCKLMQELLSHLNQLKQRLQANDIQSSNKLRRQICLRYRIQNPQELSQIQITKFNILNDDETMQVPQTTPTIYLFNSQNKQKYVVKTQQIFGQLNRMKAGNDEVVHDYMMRELIEEVQKGIKRMESVV